MSLNMVVTIKSEHTNDNYCKKLCVKHIATYFSHTAVHN